MIKCTIQEKEGVMKVSGTYICCMVCKLVSANVKSTLAFRCFPLPGFLTPTGLISLILPDASLFCNPPSLPSSALSYTELHWKWDLHESAEPAPCLQEWLKMQCGSYWQLLRWNPGPGRSVHPADQHGQVLLRQNGESSDTVLANCYSIAFIAAFML